MTPDMELLDKLLKHILAIVREPKKERRLEMAITATDLLHSYTMLVADRLTTGIGTEVKTDGTDP